MVKSYLEKVYAGFLGMNIGIRLGAPVEPTIWTYERIRNTYGEITDYVKDFKNFAADDDVNGPFYFLRALYDDAKDRKLEPQDVANAWLNYAREGVGMFWWGGYGTSTEHTAYLNLKMGIPAPQSGSIKQNGIILAEQIGGQIFIDTWGLVLPSNPALAAEYGGIAASVSHDGEGILGAKFMCACISRAFDTADIYDIIDTGLSHIPSDSLYHKVSTAVIDFYKKNPDDWRACLEMLHEEWGYDKYGGVCHIIPNAGVCIMSMVYGKGDFSRTIEIATMAGWDTDCNAGNVGTILGVATGIDGLPEHYLKPMNDSVVLSGISGYLNILDIPTYAKELALLGYKLAGEKAPEDLYVNFGEIQFDFNLPTSTHNFRISDPFFCRLQHADGKGIDNSGCIEILVDRMVRGDQCKVYYKPFYRRDEFSDERYSPVFSPTVYSGQTVKLKLKLDQWNGWETVGIAPYVRTANDKKDHLQGYVKLVQDSWIGVEFTIPDTNGDVVDEVGIVIEGYSPGKSKTLGMIYLDDFSITGKAEYTIDVTKQRKELGSITPFAVDHGAWSKVQDKIELMSCEPSFAYAGNYYSKDYEFTANLTPLNGGSHLVLVRAQGAMRGYGFGFSENNTVTFYKNSFGYTPLKTAGFNWEADKEYTVKIIAKGNTFTCMIDDKEIITVEDTAYEYGMYGFGSLSIARGLYGNFAVKEI